MSDERLQLQEYDWEEKHHYGKKKKKKKKKPRPVMIFDDEVVDAEMGSMPVVRNFFIDSE